MSKRGALVNQILEGIKNGSLVENGQLPSERVLANQLGISRILLRETIVVLETLGVVESKEAWYFRQEARYKRTDGITKHYALLVRVLFPS